MDGYFKNHHLKRVMSGQGIKYFIMGLSLSVFLSCNPERKHNEQLEKALTRVNKREYNYLYSALVDSLNKWYQYPLFNSGDLKAFEVDSLMCFNSDATRFITCLMIKCLERECNSDEIKCLLGEKVNNKWYYIKLNVVLTAPREMIQGQDVHTPLSYQQLHQIALKEIYSGYLLPSGEINEAWFTQHFEGPGWYKWDETPEQVKRLTRKDFEQRHLDYVKRMWEGRNAATHVVP